MNTIITGFGVNLEPYSNSIEKNPNLSRGSRFSARINRRYSSEFQALDSKKVDFFNFDEVNKTLLERHPQDVALRVLRQLVLQRLLVEDCEQGMSLEEVMQKISALADFTLIQASDAVNRELEALYGSPCKPNGEHCSMSIIAMGKLGAKELNVSSDIDLVYVYEEEGETKKRHGDQKIISNQEYYLKWAKGMHKYISAVTEHGFVFRIDLALRPYGNSSASVLSLQALQEYFQKTARSWERFAWLKARAVGNGSDDAKSVEKRLYAVIEPFVFRPYVDFQLMDSLREIHNKIQKQAEKNSNIKDVKLGRGGIREIEFGVQLFQVVHGGARAELRTRSTFRAIECLQKYKLLSNEQASYWEMSYRYLRTIEHRIQYLDDHQTHLLPQNDEDRIWISKTMGFESQEQFLRALDKVNTYVQTEFDQLLAKQNAIAFADEENLRAEKKEEMNKSEDNRLTEMTLQLSQRILENKNHGLDEEHKTAIALNIRQLGMKWAKALDVNRQGVEFNSSNLDQTKIKEKWLIELIMRCKDGFNSGSIKLLELSDWFEWTDLIFKRDNYLALQIEHPQVQKDIMKLMGASSWCRRYLNYYPSVIEQLVHDQEMSERFNMLDFMELLNHRKETQNKNTGIDDEEQLLKLVRREHHASLFKILTSDLNGFLTVEEVSDDLSALAQGVLSICVDWIWERLKNNSSDQTENQAPLAIIGYGKLGSKELGYGSDLDLVLLYDENRLQSKEEITLLARRLISWMTMKTSDGDLYEIDNALRPNGSSGLLVSSFDAYEKYQRQIDLNSAWTWEHQALTRARFCYGPEKLRERFEKIRQEVLAKERDENQLKLDVYEMRKKLWSAHQNKQGHLHGKFSPGGMIDVEFVVQYLILSQSHLHLELTQNIGNIALLKKAEEKGLIPGGLGLQSSNAYRHLRKKQHAASLQEEKFEIDEKDSVEIQTVKSLWLNFFKPYW